jgi:hypothetical protein
VDQHLLLFLERLRLILAGTRRVVRIKIFYSDGSWDRLSVPGVVSLPDLLSAASGESPPSLPVERAAGRIPTGIEAVILEVLRRAEKPMKAAAIAARAGKRLTSHFRETLTRLGRAGVLTKPEGGGWWLVERGEPPAKGGG